jgi:hypothetical protein
MKFEWVRAAPDPGQPKFARIDIAEVLLHAQ